MSTVWITTRPVTAANWREALALEVYPEQREFTPTVAVSLAKAYIQPDGAAYDPIAIYGHGAMVGFYSFIYYPGEIRFCAIGGFLIDRTQQGKGYGRAALLDFIATVQHNHPACTDIFLTVHPRNEVARRLYETLDFAKTGDRSDGEEVMRRPLRP